MLNLTLLFVSGRVNNTTAVIQKGQPPGAGDCAVVGISGCLCLLLYTLPTKTEPVRSLTASPKARQRNLKNNSTMLDDIMDC